MTFAFLAWRLRGWEKTDFAGARIQNSEFRSQDSGALRVRYFYPPSELASGS